VWYTAQTAAELAQLDAKTGQIRHIKLGEGSAPHGVIVGPDGAAWVTDGGLNAIVRVSDAGDVQRFPLPAARDSANLNSAIFDRAGTLWFTGQSGVYGQLRPPTGLVSVWTAPRGPGPYGMTATPQGTIFFASLAGSYVGRIDTATGSVSVLQPPTAGQGARRISSDSKGRMSRNPADARQARGGVGRRIRRRQVGGLQDALRATSNAAEDRGSLSTRRPTN
jgi:virginiamycin B lyase